MCGITTRYNESRFRARPDGGAARDRATRSTSAGSRPSGACSRSAVPAAWRCTRASRCCSKCRCAAAALSPALRRRSCARSSAATGRAGSAEALLPPANPGRARPDPGRCRRGDLSGPCHPALPAGAGDARRRSAAARPARRLGRGDARAARGRAATPTARAACRTSTGMTAPGAISRPTPSAR